LLIDKNQEEAYAMRGVIYLSKGEIEKAIVELSYAADIADEPYFYLNRGIAYLLIKNDKNAQMILIIFSNFIRTENRFSISV
jgi:tetratricopeptide (TPR) repeat protein